MVYSFDIFDTLIYRDVVEAKDIFILVQAAAYTECPSIPPQLLGGFPEKRSEAEALALEAARTEEVDLDQIYTALLRLKPELSSPMLEQLKLLELKVEQKHSFPLHWEIARVHDLLDRGERVVLLSDMYLPPGCITAILKKASPRLAELPLYLSSQIGKTKRSGGLYEHVCRMENIPKNQLIHRGDNRFSDILMAQRSGVRAELSKTGTLCETETSYAAKENGISASILAGASRHIRLRTANASPSYALGAVFTAPFFFGFIQFLIREAEQRGIRTLYFLARDGFLLKQMTEISLHAMGKTDLECVYLYLSRQSVTLAKTQAQKDALLGYLQQETDDPDCANLALVDLGWNGTIQDGLYRLLEERVPGTELMGFYYGCLGYNTHTHSKNVKVAYENFPYGLSFSAPILESLLAANHGTTEGYRESESGRWEHVLKKNEIFEVENWCFDDYRRGIRDLTVHAATVMAGYPSLIHDFRALDNGLREKLRTGVPLVAKVIGGFPYDAGLREDRLKSIAPPIGAREAVVFLFAGREKRHEMTQCLWASRLRSGRLARCLLRLDPLRSIYCILERFYRCRIPPMTMMKMKLFLAPCIRRKRENRQAKEHR